MNQKKFFAAIFGILTIFSQNLKTFAEEESWLWPTESKKISQYFGRTKYSSNHTGIDIWDKNNIDIKASRDGIATYSDWFSGYGKLVKIDHRDGYETRYAHLSEILVKKGQKVKKGQVLGKMGSTGRSTGIHLHFEINFNGIHKNPMDFQFEDFASPRILKTEQINLVYRAVLGREVKTGELESVKKLSAEELINFLKNSEEYKINIEKFIHQTYQNLLQHDVDEGGLKFWSTRSPLEIYYGIQASEEFQSKSIQEQKSSAQEILNFKSLGVAEVEIMPEKISKSIENEIYRSILGREVMVKEFNNLNVFEDELIENLISSEEYKSKVKGYVLEMYKFILNREPEKEGIEFWSTRGPLELVLGIMGSEEYKSLSVK